MDMNSLKDPRVSLVLCIGRTMTRLVDRSGIRKDIYSLYEIVTLDELCIGVCIDNNLKRRPKSGCVGSVISISVISSIFG
jgi:hypothetical protein